MFELPPSPQLCLMKAQTDSFSLTSNNLLYEVQKILFGQNVSCPAANIVTLSGFGNPDTGR